MTNLQNFIDTRNIYVIKVLENMLRIFITTHQMNKIVTPHGEVTTKFSNCSNKKFCLF